MPSKPISCFHAMELAVKYRFIDLIIENVGGFHAMELAVKSIVGRATAMKTKKFPCHGAGRQMLLDCFLSMPPSCVSMPWNWPSNLITGDTIVYAVELFPCHGTGRQIKLNPDTVAKYIQVSMPWNWPSNLKENLTVEPSGFGFHAMELAVKYDGGFDAESYERDCFHAMELAVKWYNCEKRAI